MKGRLWAFILYPESSKENWRELLEQTGLAFAVSPLHNKDINADGEKKKDHWHILIQFGGPTTYKNVKENICDLVGGTIPKKVESARGYYRYLIHADNPEKAQYGDYNNIENHNGFEIELTDTEESTILRKITQMIRTNEIKEYKDIMDYLEELGDLDYWKIASKKTVFLNSYISSYRNINKQKKIQELEDKIYRLDKNKQDII